MSALLQHTTEAMDVRSRRRWLLVGLPSVAIVATAMWFDAGVAGLAVAGIVAVVWVLAGVVPTVGVGGVLYVVLLTDGTGDTGAIVAVASLTVVLAAELLRRWTPRVAVAGIATLVVATAGLGGAWLIQPEAPVVAAVGGLLVFALFSYALHRYQLVGLGLVESPEPDGGSEVDQ